MAKIRALVAVAGHDFSWTPGEVYEVSDEDAEKWADGYRAEMAEEEPKGKDKK